jgi:hypothetical protein
MVSLIVTQAAKAAVDEYLRLHDGCENSETQQHILEHSDLIDVSKQLVTDNQGNDIPTKQWRLDTLLKGTTVYQPPPPPKPEPVSRPGSFNV